MPTSDGARTGGAPALDVFALRDSVVDEYRQFATSFTTIHAEDIREQVEAIYAGERYWPEPLIQINPSYKRSTDVGALAADGVLDPGCADIFQQEGRPLSLYKHQEQAVALAAAGESFVVTTGTGSGKSLCFFIPIVSHVLAARRSGGERRTHAIVVYPMNALANSQMEELDKFIGGAPGERPITFARYTGQEDGDERKRIANEPPDILLTNFMMLELLMTRQEETDRRVIGNCAGLRFLVLDELHTYRGRQGADVALLVRRVRERLQPGTLLCIGTSATMANEGIARGHEPRGGRRGLEALREPDRREQRHCRDAGAHHRSRRHRGIRAVPARRGHRCRRSAGRRRRRAPGASPRGVGGDAAGHLVLRRRPALGPGPAPDRDRGGEGALGRVRPAGRRLPRRPAGPPARVERARESTDLRTRMPGERSFFAFKLHQFISGAGHAYATIERPGDRSVTADGQQFLPDARARFGEEAMGEVDARAAPGHPSPSAEKRLYAVHFCRECGHEYHPVRRVEQEDGTVFLARDIDDAPPTRQEEADRERAGARPDDEAFGFLTPHRPDDPAFAFADRVEDYPESWLEAGAGGKPRLKKYYREAPASSLSTSCPPRGGSVPGTTVWLLPGSR